MRILLYDVETAMCCNIGTICAVGWILLDNDVQISSGYSLINPHCHFDKKNISIHGITPDDVVDAPSFADYWKSTLHDPMVSSLVISHSAGFDLSATEQALFECNLVDTGIDYVDSLEICKRLLPDAESYRLIDLAQMFDYTYDAHNAFEDVKALYHVLCSLRDFNHLEDIAALLVRGCSSVQNTLTNHYLPHNIVDKYRFRGNPKCHDIIETINDSLSGIRICITGDIDGYERPDLDRMIMERSGRMTTSVSKKTDFLVVGSYPEYPDGYISTKHRTALTLAEQGEKVRIITPAEFFDMLK